MADTDVQAIVDAYLNNADYDEVGSCTKGRAFITAARKYLVLPKASTHGQEETVLDTATVRQSLLDAQSWVATSCPVVSPSDAASDSGGAIHYDLADFRQ